MAKPRTFYDKIWADHLVDEEPDGTALLYIDRHIVHVLPQEYKIDGQDGVREPLGMCGVRLEANFVPGKGVLAEGAGFNPADGYR